MFFDILNLYKKYLIVTRTERSATVIHLKILITVQEIETGYFYECIRRG